jgi:hypothetical protein
VAAVQEFSLDNPMAWDFEAEWWSHVEPYEAREILERADPLKALTLFHEIHPGIDLQKLGNLSSSFLARAALHVFAG